MTSSQGWIGCDHHSRQSCTNGQSHGAMTTIDRSTSSLSKVGGDVRLVARGIAGSPQPARCRRCAVLNRGRCYRRGAGGPHMRQLPSVWRTPSLQPPQSFSQSLKHPLVKRGGGPEFFSLTWAGRKNSHRTIEILTSQAGSAFRPQPESETV